MGRKVHPIGFRLKITKTWDARWFAEGEQYVEHLQEDIAIRNLIHQEADKAGISRIEIDQPFRFGLLPLILSPAVNLRLQRVALMLDCRQFSRINQLGKTDKFAQ